MFPGNNIYTLSIISFSTMFFHTLKEAILPTKYDTDIFSILIETAYRISRQKYRKIAYAITWTVGSEVDELVVLLGMPQS